MIASPAIRPPPTDLPPLSERQQAILDTYLALRGDLATLAQVEKLSSRDLLDWSQFPAVQAHLAALTRLANQTLAFRTAQARAAALDALEQLSKSNDNFERRRAAASIMRNTSDRGSPGPRPVLPRPTGATESGGPGPNSVPGDSATSELSPSVPGLPSAPFSSVRATDTGLVSMPPPAIPEPPEPLPPESLTTVGEGVPPVIAHAPIRFAPSRELSAQDIAATVALALYTPAAQASAAAIHAYLAPGATLAGEPADPARLNTLLSQYLRPRSATGYHQLYANPGATDHASTHTLILMHARGPHTRYTLHLARSPDGPAPNCWLITHLDLIPEPNSG